MQPIRLAAQKHAEGLCLEEIEKRLESARIPDGDVGAWETCLWACECFSIYERVWVADS